MIARARIAAALAGALAASAIPVAPPREARAATPPAERVIAALNQHQVSITATFSGSRIFVYGAVRREAPPHDEALDVIIAVIGPASSVVVRRKARMLGVWANRDSVEIDSAPSFYAIASTRPLEQALSATDDLRHHIGIDRLVRFVDAPAGILGSREDYLRALIRLRRAAGLYFEIPQPVRMLENTLFSANVDLPANLVEGDYRARVFLLRDGKVIDRFETSIEVRRAGLERWIYRLSQDMPAAYGLLSILIALFAGWGASEVFRLLRR